MLMTLTSHSDHRSAEFAGRYYDGRSSRAHSVTVIFNGSAISVQGPGIKRTYRTSDAELSEPLGNAHRLLSFSDGSSCELPDIMRLKSLLSKTGHKETLVVQLQNRWRTTALAFVLLIALLAVGYRYALPVIAEMIANRVSDRMLTILSSQTLRSLDADALHPSKLPDERQEELRRRMASINFAPDADVKTKVEFRTGFFSGPNAFALPDGTIVFFDSLVQFADNDNQLVAVYAHEAGHVRHRHGMRMIIQSSVVALVLASYFGDVSAFAGALTGWALDAKYSRDFERQADAYAASTLRHNNMSPVLLADFLSKLQKEHMKLQSKESSKILDYISTHPSIDERVAEMKKIAAQHSGKTSGQ